MMQLALILILACTLLVVVALLLRGGLGGSDRLRPEPTRTERGMSPLLQVQLPSRTLMDQIFAEEDLSFIKGEGVRQIRRQFIRERRRLALSWLAQIRSQAAGILRFHLQTVRGNLALRPSVEFQLLFHTILFFATYSLLWVLVTFYGAFRARGLMRNAVTLAGRLSGLGGSILAEAGSSRLEMAES